MLGLELECVTDAPKELGYPEMKPEQLEVAATLIEGRNVFPVLPTGFGNSLCYTCLPLAFGKFTELKKHLCPQLKVAATSSCSSFISG